MSLQLGDQASGAHCVPMDNFQQVLVLDAALADWRLQLPDYLVIEVDDDLMGTSIFLSQSVAMLCRLPSENSLHMNIVSSFDLTSTPDTYT